MFHRVAAIINCIKLLYSSNELKKSIADVSLCVYVYKLVCTNGFCVLSVCLYADPFIICEYTS